LNGEEKGEENISDELCVRFQAFRCGFQSGAQRAHTGLLGAMDATGKLPSSLACGGDRGIKESNPDLGARKQASLLAIAMDQKEASVQRRQRHGMLLVHAVGRTPRPVTSAVQ